MLLEGVDYSRIRRPKRWEPGGPVQKRIDKPIPIGSSTMSEDTKDILQVSDILVSPTWPPEVRTLVESLKALGLQLQQTIREQQELIELLRAENAELKRMLFGRKSERMPDLKREVQRRRKVEAGDVQTRREAVQQKL